jgi:PilZ domain
MHQTRSVARLRSFLSGRIRFDGRLRSLECLVRDISLTGARLELSEAISLPERFELYLPRRDMTHNVLIEWRRGDQLGVTFGGPTSALSVSPEQQGIDARVQHLEAEIALMRLLLTEMKTELGVYADRSKSVCG